MIGNKLSPILEEVEDALWEFEVLEVGNPKFTEEGFRAAIKIFVAAMMDKMWGLQSKENMDINDRANMAERCGEDVRKLVKTYTSIDTHDLYK